jgi:hypothetical protein
MYRKRYCLNTTQNKTGNRSQKISLTPIFVGGVVPVLVLGIIEFNTSESVEGARGGSVRG